MHNCRDFKWPKTNKKFWREKIEGNAIRDMRNYNQLTKINWQYIVIWGCEIRASELDNVLTNILEFLEGS